MSYCDRCDRYFPHDRALWQHEEDSSFHHICRECDKDFPEWIGLKEHYVQSRRHHYCQSCNELFPSAESLEDHWETEHWYCASCRKVYFSCNTRERQTLTPNVIQIFKNSAGLHEHNRQRHWYCVECRRVFQSESNLKSHLNSSIHKPRNVYCPGANCGRSFVSISALMLHFEAGTCPSGMTRSELNRIVARADHKNVITNPSRLISGPDGPTPPTVTKTWATERSWNGSAYECFLCHATFRSLMALNTHLNSPRHQEKIYRCPNRTTCGVEFRTLSALTQHVEAEKCGVHRFKEVQDALDSLISGVRRIAL